MFVRFVRFVVNFSSKIAIVKMYQSEKSKRRCPGKRRGLNWEQLWEIIELTGKIPEGIPISTFLHTLIQANTPGAKEIMAMSESVVKDLLLEFSEKYGFIAQWEAKGLEKGMEKAAQRLQKHGMGPGQIAEALELPLETVFGYLRAQ
jgi:hypothetical protein